MGARLGVAVIGAGGIGSRHLQGLARLPDPVTLHVVEPNAEALGRAKALLAEVPGSTRHTVRPHADVSTLDEPLFLAVIATTSAVRLAVLRGLLDVARVSHVVLEKFLFSRLDEYDEADALLSQAGSCGWVNTPRRVWPDYVRLAEMVRDDPPVTMHVLASSRFAIGTTAIHFLDLMSYLGGDLEFELHGDRLQLDPRASRRSDHVEFVGTLYGRASSGAGFEYRTSEAPEVPLRVNIISPERHVIVDESAGNVWLADGASDWHWRRTPFAPVLQSVLTDTIALDLRERGTCGLPLLRESAPLHQAILRAILDGYERLAGDAAGQARIT